MRTLSCQPLPLLPLPLLPISLHADSTRFSPIILNQLLKPRMLQCLSRRDPLLRIVHEDPPQQVQKPPIELVRRRNALLQPLHPAHKFPALPRSIGEGVSQMAVLEELRRVCAVAGGGGAFGDPVDFADQVFVNGLAGDGFHHAEVLAAVVSLEEGVTGPAFDQDAAQGPEVDWVRPAYSHCQ